MGRELKRVALDFKWPLNEVWKGFINPHYEGHCTRCPDCRQGYAPEAQRFHDQWYGYAHFDPVEYGSELLTIKSTAVREFVEWRYDLNPENYNRNARLDRTAAIDRECHRLIEMWNRQWSHHLIEADVKAMLDENQLPDLTRRLRPGQSLEEFIKTRAYYLWVEAGRPDGRADEFWEVATKEHEGYWLPFGNGYIPTARDVNDWNIKSLMGHVSCCVPIKARCEREGVPHLCPTCNGNGSVWDSPESEKRYDEWESFEPPAGEGYQIWETVSEGSPVSPVFSEPETLARWMARNHFGCYAGTTEEQWLAFINGPGWAPSLVITNGVVSNGVEAV